jgi:hypothetical protein
MSKTPNLLFIENGFAHLIRFNFYGERLPEIVTTRLRPHGYVRIDDGQHYPQLCFGGSRRGATLIYYDDATLAQHCNARLYRTRKGFDAAMSRYETFDSSERP